MMNGSRRILTEFDREVLAAAFETMTKTHDPKKDGPVEDVSRFLNHSAYAPLIIKASTIEMKELPSIQHETAEKDPKAQEDLFLKAAAKNFSDYRRALLESDPIRPSKMKLKPEVSDFLANTNSDFNAKIIKFGINVLWKKFIKPDAIVLVGAADNENLARYNFTADELNVKNSSNENPTSYTEYEAALTAKMATDPNLAKKVQYLGEEMFADDLIYGLSVSQGMYETELSIFRDSAELLYKMTSLQLARTVVRRSQSLASEEFAIDANEILTLATPAAEREIESISAINLRNKNAGSRDVTEEQSFLDVFQDKMEANIFLLNKPDSNYLGKAELTALYNKALTIINTDSRARSINDLLAIKNWLADHPSDSTEEVVNVLGRLAKLGQRDVLQDYLADLNRELHTEPKETLAQRLHSFAYISNRELINFFNEELPNVGVNLNHGFITLHSESTDPIFSRGERKIGYVNGRLLSDIVRENNASLNLETMPSETLEALFKDQINTTLGLTNSGFTANLNQQFFLLMDKLYGIKLLNEDGMKVDEEPLSLNCFIKDRKPCVTAKQKINSFIVMPSATDTVARAPITLDAEYEYTAVFNNTGNYYEVLPPIKFTGQDAELVKAFFITPSSPEFSKSSYYLLAQLQENAIPAGLKTALQQVVIDLYSSNGKADSIYALQDKLAHIKNNHLTLLETNESVKDVMTKFGEALDHFTPIEQAKRKLQETPRASESIKRHNAADSLKNSLQQSSPKAALRTMAAYHRALETDADFKTMTAPTSNRSSYTAVVGGKVVTATGAHNEVVAAAKQKISKAPNLHQSSEAQAFLATQRKKGAFNWRSIGLGVSIGLAIGTAIALTVLSGGAVLPVAIGIGVGIGLLVGGGSYLHSAKIENQKSVASAEAYYNAKAKAEASAKLDKPMTKDVAPQASTSNLPVSSGIIPTVDFDGFMERPSVRKARLEAEAAAQAHPATGIDLKVDTIPLSTEVTSGLGPTAGHFSTALSVLQSAAQTAGHGATPKPDKS
ncbi:MAG: hypothetical protein Q7V63_04590 [Gammaproteobacteria bacterium]|nr:hypothetical protein [Gammaproteobacteria bacterium]